MNGGVDQVSKLYSHKEQVETTACQSTLFGVGSGGDRFGDMKHSKALFDYDEGDSIANFELASRILHVVVS